MPLQPAQKRELESKISDGIIPPCPLCGSTLNVQTEQTGKSGANGRNYCCSEDKLPAGEHCDLPPGIAYVHWKQNILQTLRNRTIMLLLTAIGSVSIAGILGFDIGNLGIFGEKDKTTDESGVTNGSTGTDRNDPTGNTDGDSTQVYKGLWLESQNKVKELEKDIQEQENNGQAIPPEYEKLRQYQWKLGLFLANYRGKKYVNETDAKYFLQTSLRNEEIDDDDDKKLALQQLREINTNSPNHDDWKNLRDLLEQHGPNNWSEKSINLALVYYNLGSTIYQKDKAQASQYWCKALQYYYRYNRNYAAGTDYFNNVVELLRLRHRTQASDTDQMVYDKYFKGYTENKSCEG